MSLTIDQRVRLLIGDMVIQNTALTIENEQLKVQVAALAPPAPEPPKDPA
jgi:regulator of replication initiation timing